MLAFVPIRFIIMISFIYHLQMADMEKNKCSLKLSFKSCPSIKYSVFTKLYGNLFFKIDFWKISC